MNDVLVVVGVGGMGQAIARRLGPGKTVLLADYHDETLQAVVASLSRDGYQVQACSVDVSSAQSVGALARQAAALGSITQVAHTAGLSPSQAPAAAILAVDLVGVALVLDEFATVIAPGGAGVVIASMAGHIFPPLTPEQERAVIQTPAHELLQLPFISELTEPALAYGVAKRANHIQVQVAAKVWGQRGARINSISPGIVSTPMGQQELGSPLGDGMRTMIAASAARRVGTPHDIAAAAAFLLGPEASFITGADLLVDGGATAAMRQ